MMRQIDNAWNLVDMARGLIALGKAHDLLGEALDELSLAIAMEAAKPTRRETGSARKGDSAGPKDIAQSQPLGNPLDTGDGK